MGDYIQLIRDVVNDKIERSALEEQNEKSENTGETKEERAVAGAFKDRIFKFKRIRNDMEFLYMIHVEDDISANNLETWEGNVNALKNHTERVVERSHGALRIKLDRLSERMINADKRTYNQESEMRS